MIRRRVRYERPVAGDVGGVGPADGTGAKPFASVLNIVRPLAGALAEGLKPAVAAFELARGRACGEAALGWGPGLEDCGLFAAAAVAAVAAAAVAAAAAAAEIAVACLKAVTVSACSDPINCVQAVANVKKFGKINVIAESLSLTLTTHTH